ncbi:ectonucleotide pyrophosphatase/phosphodiesterase [Catalinimonas sp. 4WD22]|uniref:alkaline phosphatase family protein n=1 Tax=Catalinimonas locisalis TaxID=3133978 RepID=UPI00310175AC
MNKYFFIVILSLTKLFAFGQSTPSEHVVLISVDGFRPEFYQEEKWPAPNLKQMAQDGVSASGVRGVFPSVTYPSHTTMITGAKPIDHGIYYNAPFEAEGQTGRWYWESELIQVPTLWDAVREAGLKSASFIWPVSVGAPIDYNIPEVWSLEEGYGRIQPMRDHQTPEGFLEEMEKEVLGEINERTFNGDYLNREDRIGEMAAYVLENYKPNLITVHLIAADHFQHEQGREGEKVHLAIGAIDRAIGKIKEAAERADILDKTTFIITGDHGFVDIHTTIAPNVWLVEAGLLEDRKDRGEWKAAFHTSGASAFLHLKNPDEQQTIEQVKTILYELPDKYQKLFRVVDREELDEVGADPNAVLALAPVPGINMSSSTSGEVLRSASGGTHGFYPDFKEIETGFVTWGAGISNRKQVPTIGLEDIAPIVAYLLRLEFKPKDGVLFPGIVR